MAKGEKRTFWEFYAKETPLPFYIMVGLFALSNMLLVVNYAPGVDTVVATARLIINTVLLWLCPMYLAFNLVMWRMKPVPILLGVGAIALVLLLWNFIGTNDEWFCTVVAAFLALLAYKRDYRMVLKIFLVAHLLTILAGALGLWIGFATPRHKLGSDTVGFSLGLIYPNHLGRMIYMVLTLAWYLWGQKKRTLTTAIFWIMAVVIWKWVECKTVALMLMAFPVCWWIATLLEGKKAPKVLQALWKGALVISPFLFFAVTYVLGQNRVQIHFATLHTRLYSLAMRFISAGILFDAYGFPILGQDIHQTNTIMEVKGDFMYTADIIDNAYIWYLISFGVIIFALVLLWLCLANWKMVKEGDHALLLLSVFMLGYGLIEIVAFQFEHNFIWFYPLAATALSAAKKPPKYIDMELNPAIKEPSASAEDETALAAEVQGAEELPQ